MFFKKYLKTNRVHSKNRHFKSRININFLLEPKQKNLRYTITNRAKPMTSTKIICRTKGSIKKKSLFFTYDNYATLKLLKFVSSFIWYPYKNKLYALIKHSYGLQTYIPATDALILFDFFYKKYTKRRYNIKLNTISTIIYLNKNMSIINSISANIERRAKLCTAAGSKAILLVQDKKTLTAIIRLPSKVKKCVSSFFFCRLSRLEPILTKKYLITKAGFFKNIGKKSLSRGVAKNPVDHPHGGRTKSIKYPRTPWGKTTKFK